MTSKAKPNMILQSTSVQKELQHVVAAAPYNTQMPFATTIEKQKVLMDSYFHGNGKMISSQADMLATGEDSYQLLYEVYTDISMDRNDATNANRKTWRIFSWEQEKDSMLELKSRPSTS